MSVHTARLMLVPQRRDTVAARDPTAAKVRRYRLARVQLDTPPRSGPRGGRRSDLSYLKTLHD